LCLFNYFWLDRGGSSKNFGESCYVRVSVFFATAALKQDSAKSSIFKMMHCLPWIDEVINNLKEKERHSLPLASLFGVEKPESIDALMTIVSSAEYRMESIHVEFVGILHLKDTPEVEADASRSQLETFYTKTLPAAGSCVRKATEPQQCANSIKDRSSLNILVKVSSESSEEAIIIGAVTFRSKEKSRFIPILEIGVNVVDEMSHLTEHLICFLLSVMKMVHKHFRVLPKMKEVENHLSVDDLKRLLDIYPCLLLSENNNPGLVVILKKLGFVSWKKITSFFDVTFPLVDMIKAKDGEHIMMIQRGEFVC
jgi:hypothetical protein